MKSIVILVTHGASKMYEEYDWFIAEVEAQGGVMNTDYAVLNFITMNELTDLEDRGMIVRVVEIFDGADVIFTAQHHLKIALSTG